MRRFRRLRALVETWFRGARLERELDDELRGYLEHEIERRVARGMSRARARQFVLAQEGGVESIKEQARAARIGFGVSTLLRDVRYALRAMRRTPGHSAAACLTLALGIGATVATFTVLRAVLWRPLPYPSPERLVLLDADAGGIAGAGLSHREVHELRARSRTLRHLAVVGSADSHVEIGGEIERTATTRVTADFFHALGVRPALGRLFDERDQTLRADRPIIVSHALWLRRLGGDPAAVGRLLTIDGLPREVVGVLPADFEVFLPAALSARESTAIWSPGSIEPERDSRGAAVIGRLADGVSLEAARRELAALSDRFAEERPGAYAGGRVTFQLSAVEDALTSAIGGGLRLLGAAVALVLLISCLNVANLTLARSSRRTREIAIRGALGAGRGRIVGQLLTESLVVGIAGGALGLGLAYVGVAALDWLRPTHLPRQSQIAIDGMAAVFAVGVSLAAGLALGVLPAFRLAARDRHVLRAGRGESSSRTARRLQRGLTVAEIALSIALLVAAGLMLRSFANLTSTSLGFDPRGVMTAWMPIDLRRYDDAQSGWRVYQQAIEEIRALPGVTAVSAICPPPFHPLELTRRIGRAEDRTLGRRVNMQVALPEFFDIAGTRLVDGRDFTADDTRLERRVAIVDARVASELWPGGAVGRQILLGNQRGIALEVIGVTEPVRMRSPREEGLPTVFVPFHHFPIEMALVMKTGLPAPALEPRLKEIARRAGTGRAVFEIWPLKEYVDRAIADTRFTMIVLAGFAAAALLLAGIGLYGTVAYLTAQRSREFGVRLALGATRRQILTLVSREGALLIAAGTIMGVAGAMAATRAMRGLLYGVEPLDAPTIVAAVIVTCLISITACLRPAWAASKTDPATTLGAD